MLLKEIVLTSQINPFSLHQGQYQCRKPARLGAGEVDEEMTCWGLGKISLISVASGRQFFPNMLWFFSTHLMEYLSNG